MAAVVVGYASFMNWVTVTLWVYGAHVAVPLPLLVGSTIVSTFGFAAALYHSTYLAVRDELSRAQREIQALREERRRILDLCETIELPIPFSSIVENNVGRPAPLRLGQAPPARVRAEPRAPAPAS